ncbi:MAG: ABC transporter permease, partial [Nodosilinea sp.]
MSTTIPTQSPTRKAAPSLENSELSAWKADLIQSQGLVSGAFLQETLAMTRRLFIQLQRRPTTLVAGVIQPLIWLVLFGALFQNVPAGLFGESRNYGQFLGAGIIVFTAFGG